MSISTDQIFYQSVLLKLLSSKVLIMAKWARSNDEKTFLSQIKYDSGQKKREKQHF